MRGSFVLVLAALLMTTVRPVSSQSNATDLIQVGNGARAAGLGNAFTAIADDATAISWNPAGMAQLIMPEASIVVNARAMYSRLDIEDAHLVDQRSEVTSAFSPVNFASLVYPIPTRFGTGVIGFAYRDVYDWKRSYDFKRNYAQGSYHAEVTDGFARTGGIRAWSIASAYAPSQRLMVGASASFLRGETEALTTFEVTGNTNGNTVQEVRASTAGYTGTAIELGVLLRPVDFLRVGVRAGLPYDRTSTTRIDEKDGVEHTLHVPATMTMGVAVAFDENHRVSFDYKHEPWSQARLTNTATGESQPYVDNDLASLHLGYEGLVHRDSGLQAFRIGGFTRPTVRLDARGERVAGIGGAIGTGWATSAFSFDIAATYVHMDTHARWPQSGASKRFDVQDNELLITASFIVYR
jgi:long-subunit fatty acid transport protein